MTDQTTYCRGDFTFLGKLTTKAKMTLELVADDLDKGIYPSDQVVRDCDEIHGLLCRVAAAVVLDRMMRDS